MSPERSGSVRAGLLWGAAGGLAMVLVSLALRVTLGIPLPVELMSDRIIPLMSIRQFSTVARLLGGLELSREIALFSSFALMVGLGALGGLGLRLWDRGRGRSLGILARPWALATAGLAALWIGFAVLLWPVLESNYRGLSFGAARLASALGLAAMFAAYGAIVLWGGRPRRRAAAEPESDALGRRRFLLAGVAVAAVALTGGLARYLYGRATIGPSGYDGLRLRGPRTDPVTPNGRFYIVTKNYVDPDVDPDLWRLAVSGSVERPHTYTLPELRGLPAVEQETTLECISNGVGGGLMSNAVWRGIPLPALLEPAGVRHQARRVLFHASDGYTHSLSLERALRPTTLVVHEMNGVPLPGRHGFPVRLVVPGAYGEISVKWLDRVEVVDRAAEGYYERQGWLAEEVRTTSRFDRPRNGQTFPAGMPVPLGGVAYAGDRGIGAVEVSVDGGATWDPVSIDYPGTRLTWVVWSSAWTPADPGSYRLVVRAVDGTGEVQEATRRPVSPSGASGRHTIRVRVTD
jgi:DMSO/TMAO reductase YedYZ molybdopterin-dependent catalytic subunit